jgi:hypothetical protein
MAELLHNKVRAETPGAALELPPVVLLTATGIICGKVTSIWGYLTRLRVLKPEDGPARAATEALLTDPNLQVGAEPIALNRIRTIYLVDVSVSPPGRPNLRTHLRQLSVSIDEVVAWTLDNDDFHETARESEVGKGDVVT